MILDITQQLDDGSLDTVRFKPRNKAVCRGALCYRGEEIASINTLAIYYTNYEGGKLVSGRFDLEWYRKEYELEFFTNDLSIYAEYGEGKPPEPINGWTIPGIAILQDGVPLAVGGLRDLMVSQNIFFAKEMTVRNYVEELEREEQLVKEQFGKPIETLTCNV